MANPFHTFFGQVLTQVDLNQVFDELFAGVDRFIEDFGYSGIVAGGTVTQHTPPNLTVDIAAPTIVYDQFAHRMQFNTPVSVSLSHDENGASTALVGNSNEKWLSIFIQFTSTPSAPQTDDLGNTVYTRDIFGYKLNVVQGSEAPANTAVPPALRGDQILLADVKRSFATTTFLNANISTARAQTVIDIAGAPLSLKAKGLKSALQAMLTTVNSAINLVTALDVDTMATDGASGSPHSIPPGTVHGAFLAILDYINTLRGDVDEIDVPDVSNVARLNQNNTFTRQLFVDNTNASEAMLGTGVEPADDPTPNNRWKLLFSFKIDGGQYVYFYSGRNASDSAGAFAIVTNSLWRRDELKWAQRDGTKPSQALVWNFGKLRVCGKGALGGTWPGSTARWDDWEAAGTLETGVVNYEPARTETFAIPIINYGFGSQMDPAGYIVANTTNPIHIGVQMPRRSRWGTLRVSHYQGDSNGSLLRLVRTIVPYSSPGAMSFTTIGMVESGPAASGHHTTDIPLPDQATNPAEEYRLIWTPGAVGNRLQGILMVNARLLGPD